MINELFEIFPEYVAFQILTYRPHPDAKLIKEFWEIHNRNLLLWTRHHKMGMRRIIEEIDRIVADMNDVEEETGIDFEGFDGYYMYNVSPNMFRNIYG